MCKYWCNDDFKNMFLYNVNQNNKMKIMNTNFHILTLYDRYNRWYQTVEIYIIRRLWHERLGKMTKRDPFH